MVYNKGQAVECESAGSWYPAKIVEVNKAKRKVKVHYQGWKARWDEWLPYTSDRLRNDEMQEDEAEPVDEEPPAAAAAPAPALPLVRTQQRPLSAAKDSDSRPTAPSQVQGGDDGQSGEEESGEDESGEEESGDEDSSAASTVQVVAAPEPPKISKEKREAQYKAQMQEARAARKANSAEVEEAQRQHAEKVQVELRTMAQKRWKFLEGQGDIFASFMDKYSAGPDEAAEAAQRPDAAEGSVAGSGKAEAAAGSAAAAAACKSPGRRRMTEREEDEQYMKEQEEAEEEIPRLSAEQTGLFISTGSMRPYQVEGLNWLVRLYHRGLNGILADEMGLGKTLQTISMLGFLHHFKGVRGPHIIVVPKSTLGNWCNEFREWRAQFLREPIVCGSLRQTVLPHLICASSPLPGRWTPQLRVLKFYGSKDERALIRERDLVYGQFDVVVVSYETAIKEKAALTKFSWEYIVIDEAHRIKNENSLLSQIMRLYTTKCRLLITGTPLQNNLHELWALLNFLLPDVFGDSERFEEFTNAAENFEEGGHKQAMINQLHRLLRPFILRRLKVEVERGIPDKHELTVYCKLTAAQIATYKAVLKNNVEVLNGHGEKVKLLNIVMQLRKACNHPYLFDGVEDKTLDPFGEHLVENSGKLMLLDKLLPRLQREGSRVLIFSQMTRLLDILEDYCTMRGHDFCRIDGQSAGDARDEMIDDFNREGSSKFIFLLSTRAGGVGINLATADVVVIYDSDWNPQMDLQAQDRAHRIGQKKPVRVFRLITDNTIEIKILDRAMKKLHLDMMVIKSGKLQEEQASLHKNELMNAIRYGADDIFKSEGAEIADEDIDEILQRAAKKTAELNSKFEGMKKEGLSSASWSFGADEEVDEQQKLLDTGSAFIDIGKRSRKTTSYSENDVFKDLVGDAAMGVFGASVRKSKGVVLHDFQFFDEERLRPLLEKQRGIKQTQAADGTVKIEHVEKVELTPREERLKSQLLVDGFNWSKREFNNFVRACTEYGRDDVAGIASELEDKTKSEVEKYSIVFWEKGPETLGDWDKYVARIEEGERKIERLKDMILAFELKCNEYDDPVFEMELKGKSQFGEQLDRYLVWGTNQLGWGNWEALKAAVQQEPLFRFDLWAQSRTAMELKRRVEGLARQVEKELAEPLSKERKKRQKQAEALAQKRREKFARARARSKKSSSEVERAEKRRRKA